MPFFLFFPRPVVDFWLTPDYYFDESYELNISWDFFGEPDIDEGYEYLDGWPGAIIPSFTPDYDGYEHVVDQSYEDGYWNSDEQSLYPEIDGDYLTIWLDAQDDDTLSLDGYGNVQTWVNKETANTVGNAVQATVADRPGVTTVDGYQYLSFAGGDNLSMTHDSGDLTRITGATNSRNWHFFAVFRVSSITTNSATADSNDGLFSTSNLTIRHNVHFRNTPNRIFLYKQDSAGLSVTQNISLDSTILVEMYQRTDNNPNTYANVWGVYLNDVFISEQTASTTSGNTIVSLLIISRKS